MTSPKLTHWVFYKGKWRHCWLQNTAPEVPHETVTSPALGMKDKLEMWIHEDKDTIYTEMELFAKGINPRVQTTTPLD